MDEREWLTSQFEQHRGRLRAVAYRMLGSVSEAEDALQDAWLRVSRADTSSVENPGGWLTTVVARVCLNVLRSREQRREEPFDEHVPEPAGGVDPEQEAVLADSVGLALLVVLETLTPAERLSFVLHDMFAVPFDEIAPMIQRTPDAARQLASRARRRVKGDTHVPAGELARQREIVNAYLAAARDGDFQALVVLLHPDVVLRADQAAMPTGKAVTLKGAKVVAEAATASAPRARITETALVNGSVGLVMAPAGRLSVVLSFVITDGRIIEIDVIGDDGRLKELDIAVLAD